jgi:hypothetical protein
MTKINSPDQLPIMVAELKRQRFYGQVHLVFRDGRLSRMITEHSQVFDLSNSPEEGTSHDPRNNFPRAK